MCLAQGQKHRATDEARTHSPSILVKHSITEPLVCAPYITVCDLFGLIRFFTFQSTIFSHVGAGLPRFKLSTKQRIRGLLKDTTQYLR